MFIAIIGTRFSGKSVVEDYLVNTKGFTQVRLLETDDTEPVTPGSPALSDDSETVDEHLYNELLLQNTNHLSFLSMSNSALPSPLFATFASSMRAQRQLFFSSPEKLLLYVTKNWRANYVTVDLLSRELIDIFARRPFFMLVTIDAPLFSRFERSRSTSFHSLEDFVKENDYLMYGSGLRYYTPSLKTESTSSLHHLNKLAHVHVINSFESIHALHLHLSVLNLLDQNRLRPNWDIYFMKIASWAARRSNCMKRRVGAVLVRDHRIISTGYNGTPRGLTNCNEGGCPVCNNPDLPRQSSSECLCLHAEENALLEVGRGRVGEGAVLYCDTCPCLSCAIKIVQVGVREVVYDLSYKLDEASAKIFKEAGVKMRRLSPNDYDTPFVDLDTPPDVEVNGTSLPRG